MKNIKIKIFIGIILCIIVFFGYRFLFTKSNAASTYQTATAQRGSLIINLSTSGSVAATNSRSVTTTASGVVSKVFVKEGQKVSTGTPLMFINLDLEGRQQLQSAYAQFQSAQNNLTSTQNKIYSLQSALTDAKNIFDNQWANGSPDDPTYIQKHNDYLSAQANYDALASLIKQNQTSLYSAQLSYQLASATVYSPISGIISAISLTPGMIINSTNKIAIVKTNATPAISVSLTETDVTKVKVGNKVTITLDALPDKTFTGKIIAIDTSGTVSSGVVSYTTTIQFDSNVDGVLSNMSATANIITDVIDDAITVPSSAVQTSNGQTTVRELINGKLTNINVEIGKTNGTETQIISGVKEGDVVVTSVTTPNTTTNNRSNTGNSVFSSQFGGPRLRGN